MGLLLADPETGKRKSGALIFIASLFISIYLAIDGMVKTHSATCGLCQEGSLLACCKTCAECFGRCIMTISGCLAILWILVGFIVAAARRTPFGVALRVWLQAAVLSWLLNVVQCCVCFTCSWRGQKDAEAVEGSDAYPHGMDFPNNDQLMWGGDSRICWC